MIKEEYTNSTNGADQHRRNNFASKNGGSSASSQSGAVLG
jgi:hypothetical protein